MFPSRWLTPFSWLYGAAVALRNACFDAGLLKSHTFSVPVIAVGNITVGGTGKTPHVEYLIRLLEDKVKVAVLSRGYKRKTKGYVLADENVTAADIGDEPWQMMKKFPKVTVAVCEKRVVGIRQLMKGDADVVLLDDAYQHRYVTPGINILLVDYHRPIITDHLLPAGNLRESPAAKRRADIVIITKCPRELKPMEIRVLTKSMGLYPYQKLYFTTLCYQPLHQLFGTDQKPLEQLDSNAHVLLLTGIASPARMKRDVAEHVATVDNLAFGDHHNFTAKDMARAADALRALPKPHLVITTEKDAARIAQMQGLDEELRQALYVLPVGVKFMLDQEENFNENIIGYVRKNSRNSILVKSKDDHKSADSHRAGNGSRTISFRNN